MKYPAVHGVVEGGRDHNLIPTFECASRNAHSFFPKVVVDVGRVIPTILPNDNDGAFLIVNSPASKDASCKERKHDGTAAIDRVLVSETANYGPRIDGKDVVEKLANVGADTETASEIPT